MTQSTPDTPSPTIVHPLVLIDEGALGRITIDMQAFFEFSFWMAEELEDLVSKGPRHREHREASIRCST